MASQTPHPFPVPMRDEVNFELTAKGVVDEDARFVVRRMIANAYALGFQDGSLTGSQNAWSDQRAKQDAPA